MPGTDPGIKNVTVALVVDKLDTDRQMYTQHHKENKAEKGARAQPRGKGQEDDRHFTQDVSHGGLSETEREIGMKEIIWGEKSDRPGRKNMKFKDSGMGGCLGVNLGFYFWGRDTLPSSLLPLPPSPTAKTHTHASEFSVLIL